MNNKHRINIARKAKQMLKIDHPKYIELPSGEIEVLMDEYIGKVCELNGYTLSEFYFTDGQTLNKILGH